MASIYLLKSRFQGLLRPAVGWLHRWGATANQVTLAAAVASLLVVAVILRSGATQPAWFALLPGWMLLRMALNAIDGMLAREFGQQSRLGAFLNELCDLVADAALYLALLAVLGVSPWPLLALVAMAWLSEYAGVLGVMVGASRRYDGPMGKSDRAFVVGGLGLCLAFGWADARWIEVAAWGMAAGGVVTTWRRVRGALAEKI